MNQNDKRSPLSELSDEDRATLSQSFVFRYSPQMRSFINHGLVTEADAQLATAHVHMKAMGALHEDLTALVERYTQMEPCPVDWNAVQQKPSENQPTMLTFLARQPSLPPKALTQLIALGCDPNIKNSGKLFYREPIMQAIERQDIDKINELISQGASVRVLNRHLAGSHMQLWRVEEALRAKLKAIDARVDEIAQPEFPVEKLQTKDLLMAANLERLGDVMQPSRWFGHEQRALELIGSLPPFLQQTLQREQLALLSSGGRSGALGGGWASTITQTFAGDKGASR